MENNTGKGPVFQNKGQSVPSKGGTIRNVTVGILAVATLAAASLLMRRRRPNYDWALAGSKVDVDDLYAAGL